ncbi:MAG: carboxypeptidase regulatory-like domain-containing protein, partial [Armatimonadota bacterium]
MKMIKTFLCILILSLASIELGAVTIGQAKILPDNTNIALTGKIVSRVFPGGIFYIQEPDRTSGIRVSTAGVMPVVGDIVDVSGNLLTYNISSIPIKRFILASSVIKTGQTTAPGPFGMLSKSVGGSQIPPNLPGILNSQGPNNMGLLAKISGTITYISGNRVIVDDGYGISNENNSKGVTVISPDTPDFYVGEFVNSTGIISGWVPSGFSYAVPAILVSDLSDIQLVGKDGETGNLTGTVMSTFDELLEGVNVQLTPSSQTTNTNSQGIYSFASLPAGTYKAVFTKSGYNTLEKTINVHNAMTNYLDVIMQSQTGKIRIYVRDNHNRPLQQASVSVSPGEHLIFTDINGYAEITNLNPNNYEVKVCVQG